MSSIHTKSFTKLAIGAMLIALSGCSLRYDFSTECQATEDCAKYEGDGVFYQCVAGECLGDDAVECRQDTDCTSPRPICNETNRCVAQMVEPDMKDEPDMKPAVEPDMPEEEVDQGPDTACTKNSECIAGFGESFICGSEGECIDALDSFGDCTRIHYSSTANPDNVVFIGSLLPLVEPFGTLIGRPIENSIQLAVDTINDDGGLAGGRKIAWISCDSKGNAQIAQRAATHLSTRVKTPAIIGPLFSEAFIATVSNVTNNADVFAITPTATSPSVANQRQNKDLVWRDIASDTFQAKGIVERINDLGPGKVLVLYKDDKYGNDLRGLVVNELSEPFGENLRVVSLPNPIDLDDPSEAGISTSYGTTIAGAVGDGFSADVVLIIGTNEGAITAGAYLELIAANAIPISFPSRIILSHGVIPAFSDLANTLDARMLGMLIPLFEGIAPLIFEADSVPYKRYVTNYSLAFNNTQPALASTTTFDAVMAIALSMGTLSADEPITGKAIAGGMSKLVDKENGTRLEFYQNTSFFSDAIGELQSGNTLDIVGVSGELDFDLDTGEVYTPVVGYVATKNEVTGAYTIKQVRSMSFPNAPETDAAVWEETPTPDE